MVDFQCQRLNNRPTCGGDHSLLAEISWWVCMAILLLGLVLTYAWFNNQIVDMNMKVEQLKAKNDRLRASIVELRARQAALLSPESVAARAQGLGLVTADQENVHLLQAHYTEVPSDAVVAAVPPRETLHE
jgi:cell division protein FtsB